MDAARKYRYQPVQEDAGERGFLFAIEPAESEWPEDWIETVETWPDWRCDDCGSPVLGRFLDCSYCGSEREDIDQCV